jgi:hypothetical protein
LDTALSEARAVVVLLTGDEESRLRDQFHQPGDPPRETFFGPQPRANVLFEAGLALGCFANRTILVELEDVRMVSDIEGLYRLKFDGTPKTRRELVEHLRFAGCAVDETSIEYLKAGDFDAAKRKSSLLPEMNGELGIWRISNTVARRQLQVDVYSRGASKKWVWLRCMVRSTEPLSEPLLGVVSFHLDKEFDIHFRHADIPVARGEAHIPCSNRWSL